MVTGSVVLVVVVDVVEVLVEVVVEVLVDVVEPQNCTLEIAGGLPLPTCGSPAFEKEPSCCGGATVKRTAAEPPFTITATTGSVECHVAPVDDAFDSVTTFSLPAGFSNVYEPWL